MVAPRMLGFGLTMLLTGCISQQQLTEQNSYVRNVNTSIDAANAGDRAAALRVCIGYYNLVVTRRVQNDTEQAWYWCSNLAKENVPQAQFLTGRLLGVWHTNYARQFNPPSDVYLEALYWYKRADANGWAGAGDAYADMKQFYDAKYGSGRSDLFGKIVAGAFIAGVAASANASAATTAKAVGAFAADAATDGRAQASASFLKNAGPSQLPAPRRADNLIAATAAVPVLATKATAPASPDNRQQTAGKPTAPVTVADKKSQMMKQANTADKTPSNKSVTAPANGNPNIADNTSATATKTAAPEYTCPSTEKITVEIGNVRTLTDTGWKMVDTSAEQACIKAQERAMEFAAQLPKETWMGPSSSRTKNIEECVVKRGQYDRKYALVTVNYVSNSTQRCNALSKTVSR